MICIGHCGLGCEVRVYAAEYEVVGAVLLLRRRLVQREAQRVPIQLHAALVVFEYGQYYRPHAGVVAEGLGGLHEEGAEAATLVGRL